MIMNEFEEFNTKSLKGTWYRVPIQVNEENQVNQMLIFIFVLKWFMILYRLSNNIFKIWKKSCKIKRLINDQIV